MKSGGLALFGVGMMGGIPAFMAEAAASDKLFRPYKRKRVLVCIFQRGAMDGLMAVTPFSDPYLAAARPTLSLQAVAGGRANTLIDLDGRWGMHPGLKAFEPLYRDGRLAIVHGIGSPNNTRSHFDAQDYMESGTPFNKGTASGWLNRAVGLLGHDAATPFTAVSVTSALPRCFYGDQPALAISNLQDFAVQLRGNPAAANTAARSFEDLYDQTSAGLLHDTGKESFEAMKVLQQADVQHYRPAGGGGCFHVAVVARPSLRLWQGARVRQGTFRELFDSAPERFRAFDARAGGPGAVGEPPVRGHHAHRGRLGLGLQPAHDLLVSRVPPGPWRVGDLDHRRADRWPRRSFEDDRHVLALGGGPALEPCIAA